MFNMVPASQADLAIGPGESDVRDPGMVPLLETNPTVGLSAKRAARCEGEIIDPSELKREGYDILLLRSR